MNSTLQILLGVILCASAGSLRTQPDSTLQAEPLLTAEYDQAIRLSLSHFLDPVIPNCRIGYDHRITDRSYLRQEVAVYFESGFNNKPDGLVNLSGFGLRTAYRYIKPFRFARSKRERSYVEFALDYRYFDVIVAGDFNRDGFSQRFNYSVWQHSIGMNVIWGQIFYLGKRLRFDISGGVGLYQAIQQFSEVPSDAQFRTNEDVEIWNYEPGGASRVRLIVPLSANLVYVW